MYVEEKCDGDKRCLNPVSLIARSGEGIFPIVGTSFRNAKIAIAFAVGDVL